MGATIFNSFWAQKFSLRKKYYVNVYSTPTGGTRFSKPCVSRFAANQEAAWARLRSYTRRLYVVAVYRKPSNVFDRIAFDDAREMRHLWRNAAQAEAWPHPYPPRN